MKVKELLSGPEKWTQSVYVRNKDGTPTQLGAAEAFSFCLRGAIYFCYCDATGRYWTEDKAHKALNLPPCESLAEWNDAPERTFEDVRKLVEELDI